MIYISKAEADANSHAFRQALARAKEENVNLVHVTPEMAVLPHEKRGDPAAYQEARRCAQALGTSVSFLGHEEPAPDDAPPVQSKALHHDTESSLFILAGQVEPRDYQRLTQKARADGRSVVALKSWDDAPADVQEALNA